MKVEISAGEALDKISILEIKLNQMKDEQRRENVKRELGLLIDSVLAEGLQVWLLGDEYKELLETNQALWIIEDRIRNKEHKKEFDEEFISLARSVYIMNDQRADIKRRINEQTKSLLIEEKEYTVKYEPKCGGVIDESDN